MFPKVINISMSEHICICQFINIMFIITTCSPSSFDLTKKLTQWFSDFETLYPYDNQWRKPSMWPFENSFNAHFTLINCNVFLRFYLTCHVFLICQYFDNDVARTSEIYTYPLKWYRALPCRDDQLWNLHHVLQDGLA